MARVRKINVSQVEGRPSYDDDNLPAGEMALYDDDNGSFVLVIHDGVNSTSLNRVLGKGIIYGHNADAGDGSQADTIKLIPDIPLFENGSNQYIVVDPTGGEPGHIHLRAGGTQDASTADLYLGGEETCVRVSDTTNNVVIRTTDSSTREWLFQTTGTLILPGALEHTNGTLATGGGVLVTPGSDYIVGTQRNQTVSGVAMGGTAGQILIVDTTFVDDITAVQPGWEINAGTLEAPIWYTVAMVIPGATDFSIDVPGFVFSVGDTYTFRNPVPDAYDWAFGSDGVVSTPGLGTISHQDNDFKIEVSGTDVILLRTASGEFVLESGGDLLLPDGSTWSSGVLERPLDEDFEIHTSYTAMSSPPGPASSVFRFGANGTLTVPELITGAGEIVLRSGTGATVNIESGEGGTIEIGYQPNPPSQIYIGTATATPGQETITSLNTNRLAILADPPTSSAGKAGDVEGLVAFDNDYMYRCVANYVGPAVNLATLASSGNTVYVSSTGYAGDLVADYTANPIGWSYAGVTITAVAADNTFGPGYVLTGPTSFGVMNGDYYALISPNVANIWKRVALTGGTW